MDLTITAAIDQIKADVAHYLTPNAMKSVCRKVGHTWHRRILDPVTTVHLYLLQVLHGNTACSNVPRLGKVNCTGEAYNQARHRLPRLRPTTMPHSVNHLFSGFCQNWSAAEGDWDLIDYSRSLVFPGRINGSVRLLAHICL